MSEQWKLVPVEPTEEMLSQGMGGSTGVEGDCVADWIVSASKSDRDAWEVIGGYPNDLHPSYAGMEWKLHVAKSLYVAMLAASPLPSSEPNTGRCTLGNQCRCVSEPQLCPNWTTSTALLGNQPTGDPQSEIAALKAEVERWKQRTRGHRKSDRLRRVIAFDAH